MVSINHKDVRGFELASLLSLIRGDIAFSSCLYITPPHILHHTSM